MQKMNPISVYIERRFPADRRGAVESFFEQANRFLTRGWEPFSNARGQGFKMGKQIAFSFDYESDSSEVKAYLECNDREMIVSIGNSGFPFEPMMSRKRYQAIADKLAQFVGLSGAD